MNELILMLISSYLELDEILNLLKLFNNYNFDIIIHNNLAFDYLKNLIICSNECEIINCNIILEKKKLCIEVAKQSHKSPNIYIHTPKHKPGLGITTLCFPLEELDINNVKIKPLNKIRYNYICKLEDSIYYNFEPYYCNGKSINLYSMCKFKKKINKIIF